MDGNTSLLRSTIKNKSHVNMNMNMNSVKETVKKTNKSPAAKSAELSSPATPRNALNNSSIDVKKVLAPKPVAQASIPAPAAAKVSTIAAKVKDASTPAPQSFALLAETTPAPAPKAVAVEAKKSPGQKSAV